VTVLESRTCHPGTYIPHGNIYICHWVTRESSLIMSTVIHYTAISINVTILILVTPSYNCLMALYAENPGEPVPELTETLTQSSSSRMCAINRNWSPGKQRSHLQSVAAISRHLALSEDRIQQCGTSSWSCHKDTISVCKSPFLSTGTAVSLFCAKHNIPPSVSSNSPQPFPTFPPRPPIIPPG